MVVANDKYVYANNFSLIASNLLPDYVFFSILSSSSFAFCL